MFIILVITLVITMVKAIKFKAKMFRAGNSDVVAVPAHYVRNELVQRGKEYWFEVKEVTDVGATES